MINDNVKSWTTLIVDDEPDNLGVAQTVLSFYGARVHTATDGEEGLEILKTISPTFILLDLSMPKMDGWEMIKAVRENPAQRHIPVIALTAHVMEGDKERVLQAGFDGYISKPFRLVSFLTQIKQCLGLIATVG